MNSLPTRVYLVGAGPGSADLITVRGARLLAGADAVFYDALAADELLDLAPKAEKIFVGKRAHLPSPKQTEINQRMVVWAKAHQGAQIVRLKGGDPMIFGRADEEIRALLAANINVEVVPGVTAASAASAVLGQSLTLRDVSRSVALCTFASANPFDEPMPPVADTLIIYMGGADSRAIAGRLLGLSQSEKNYAHLWLSDTPVVVVQAVATVQERILPTTLKQLSDGGAEEWLVSKLPTLIMVGQAFAHPNALRSLRQVRESENAESR